MSGSDTPLASASSGAKVANSNGREMAARAHRLTAVNANSAETISRLTPNTLPNRIAVAWVACVEYR